MVIVSKSSAYRLDIELSDAFGADAMRSLIDDLIEKIRRHLPWENALHDFRFRDAEHRRHRR